MDKAIEQYETNTFTGFSEIDPLVLAIQAHLNYQTFKFYLDGL